MKKILFTLTLLASLVTAHGQSINGSSTDSTGQTFDLTTLGTTDWVTYSDQNFKAGGTGLSTSPTVLDGTISDAESSGGDATQTYTDGTSPSISTNTSYVRTGAANAGGGGPSNGFDGSGNGLETTATLTAGGNYTLNFLVNSFDSSDTFTATLNTGQSYTQTLPGAANGTVDSEYTLNLTGVAANSTLTVSDVLNTPIGGNGGYNYANITFQAGTLSLDAAPEPGTASMMLLALLALGLFKVARRSSKASSQS